MRAGVRLKELILGAWGALTLQAIATNEFDSAGVLNPAAAVYYRHHPEVVPLTRESFINES